MASEPKLAAVEPNAAALASEPDAARPSRPPLPARASVVVVGGGVAGLACAWQLAEYGVPDVLLLEAEPLLAMHASGRNAAIFLPLEESVAGVWLAARSRELLDERAGTSWLWAQGVALVAAARDALDQLSFTARRLDVFHERWSAAQLAHKLPLLEAGDCNHALFLPLAGVMDVHAVLMNLRRWALRAGVRIETSAPVAAIESERGKVAGVQLLHGPRVASERVVLASGAWAGKLGRVAGSRLTLTPLRRHLVYLVGRNMPTWRAPVVWRVDAPHIYCRPEAGGLLASPCDETPFEPCIPPSDPHALEALATRLERFAPKVLESASVRRTWACLRTMTEDRELAVGADGRVAGLYWCAGLGGRGMSCGAAAGELLARALLGLSHPLLRALSPERFA